MSLQQTILADITRAMKERDAETLGVLRMIKAAFIHASKEAGATTELDDSTVITLLRKEAKKRQESAHAFHTAKRPELAQQEEKELTIIERYLPAQMATADIESIVAQTVEELGSHEFGAVMGAVMKKVQGQADGNTVRAVVQQYLSTHK